MDEHSQIAAACADFTSVCSVQVVIRVSRAPASWGWNDEAGSSGVLEPGAQIVSMPESPSQPRKCFVLVEVEDNGPGVPPDVAARLFKPFTQVLAAVQRVLLSLYLTFL